jgi:hypothetical protein
VRCETWYRSTPFAGQGSNRRSSKPERVLLAGAAMGAPRQAWPSAGERSRVAAGLAPAQWIACGAKRRPGRRAAKQIALPSSTGTKTVEDGNANFYHRRSGSLRHRTTSLVALEV